MSRDKWIISIVVWSIVAVVFLGVLITGLLFGKGIAIPTPGDRRDIYTDEHNMEDVTRVEITWHIGNVTVKPSDDGYMHIRQTSRYDAEPLEWTDDGSQVKIRQPITHWLFISWFTRSSDLEVTLPAKQYEEFQLTMTSGNSTVESISAQRASLKLTSGKLTANGMQADTISAKVTSGKLVVAESTADTLQTSVTSGTLECGGSFKAIDSKATSGRSEITTAVAPDSLDVDLTSGKIIVAIPENDGFVLTCKKSSGSIDSEFDLSSSLGESKRYTYGLGSAAKRQYAVKMTSGSFHLNKFE